MQKTIGCFEVSVASDGVALVVFSRPPVNSVSLSVYEDIAALVAFVSQASDIRVVVLSAPESSRAWCGGADVKDFVGMDTERRKERYAFINQSLPGFYNLDRPVIAIDPPHGCCPSGERCSRSADRSA